MACYPVVTLCHEFGFIAVATNTGKTVQKNQTADELYYAVRYLSYIASVTVQQEQEISPQWPLRVGYQMGALAHS